jgi:hypothetical protein
LLTGNRGGDFSVEMNISYKRVEDFKSMLCVFIILCFNSSMREMLPKISGGFPREGNASKKNIEIFPLEGKCAENF